MKRRNEKDGALVEIVCNCCGKTIPCREGVALSGAISMELDFGYFSRKDGIGHRFDLCEECYDDLIRGFVLPVEESQRTELV